MIYIEIEFDSVVCCCLCVYGGGVVRVLVNFGRSSLCPF